MTHIGLLRSTVLQLKLLFTKICSKKSGWDSLLNADIQFLWSSFLKNLGKVNTIHNNRHIFSHETNYKDIQLHGFCDTTNEAYTAAVYLQIVNNNGAFINLLTAKSKIVPNKNLSIPHIELLSCLLLSKLVTPVKDSLKFEVYICRTFCCYDYKVALWWIKQVNKVWKVWVSNRVCIVRENVPVECWNFVRVSDNPTDLTTRTNTSSANLYGEKWFHGPSFLQLPESEWSTLGKTFENSRDITFNEEGGGQCFLLNSVSLEEGIRKVIAIEKLSCLKKLLRVTGYVISI